MTSTTEHEAAHSSIFSCAIKADSWPGYGAAPVAIPGRMTPPSAPEGENAPQRLLSGLDGD